MSPVIRQNTNEQDRKVATRIPCCAGFSLCAARLQNQHLVSLTCSLRLFYTATCNSALVGRLYALHTQFKLCISVYC